VSVLPTQTGFFLHEDSVMMMMMMMMITIITITTIIIITTTTTKNLLDNSTPKSVQLPQRNWTITECIYRTKKASYLRDLSYCSEIYVPVIRK
jgi:uncharacterized protein YjaG (DUF416 family)